MSYRHDFKEQSDFQCRNVQAELEALFISYIHVQRIFMSLYTICRRLLTVKGEFLQLFFLSHSPFLTCLRKVFYFCNCLCTTCSQFLTARLTSTMQVLGQLLKISRTRIVFYMYSVQKQYNGILVKLVNHRTRLRFRIVSDLLSMVMH